MASIVLFFQFRSVSVSISIIRHSSLFFCSYSGNRSAVCSFWRLILIRLLIGSTEMNLELHHRFSFKQMLVGSSFKLNSFSLEDELSIFV